jgi:hypothetical protein
VIDVADSALLASNSTWSNLYHSVGVSEALCWGKGALYRLVGGADFVKYAGRCLVGGRIKVHASHIHGNGLSLVEELILVGEVQTC